MREFLSRFNSEQNLICLSYFDGPVKGVLKEVSSRDEFFVRMVGERENDDDDNIRIYLMSPLDAGTFARVFELCPKERPVKWPIWVPSWSDSNSERQLNGKIIWELINEPTYSKVMAWEMYRRICLAEKDLREYKPTAETDWLKFLGI